MRIFIAIDLPDPVVAALERVQDELPFGRIADAETLHLTLAFAGEQPQGVVADIHEALQTVRAEAFDLRLGGLDTFGGKSPRVLFAGVAESAALSGLHRAVRGALHNAGVVLERKRFRPHVTLARFGHRLAPGEPARLAEFLTAHGRFSTARFEVTEFALFHSTLTPTGPIHEALARYPLGGGSVG